MGPEGSFRFLLWATASARRLLEVIRIQRTEWFTDSVKISKVTCHSWLKLIEHFLSSTWVTFPVPGGRGSPSLDSFFTAFLLLLMAAPPSCRTHWSLNFRMCQSLVILLGSHQWKNNSRTNSNAALWWQKDRFLSYPMDIYIDLYPSSSQKKLVNKMTLNFIFRVAFLL